VRVALITMVRQYNVDSLSHFSRMYVIHTHVTWNSYSKVNPSNIFALHRLDLSSSLRFLISSSNPLQFQFPQMALRDFTKTMKSFSYRIKLPQLFYRHITVNMSLQEFLSGLLTLLLVKPAPVCLFPVRRCTPVLSITSKKYLKFISYQLYPSTGASSRRLGGPECISVWRRAYSLTTLINQVKWMYTCIIS